MEGAAAPGVYELNPALPVEAICAGAVCVAILAAVWAARDDGPLARRGAVLALRLVAIICTALLMLGPERTIESVSRERARLAVVCDASRSLSITDAPDGRSRSLQARRCLDVLIPALRAAAPDADVDWYLAGPSLACLSDPPAEIPASGDASPLGDAILEATLGETPDGHRPAGALRKARAALLISDGLVTRGISLAEAAARLAGGGARLFAVGLGDPSREPPDVEIADLRAESPVTAGGEARVSAAIRATGLRSDSVEFELRCDGREISVRRVSLSDVPGAGGSIRAGKTAFSFPAGAPGMHRVRAHVIPAPGELRLLNNTRFAAFEVERKSFRVLLAASRLTPDYRAVASALSGHREFQQEAVADFVHPAAVDATADGAAGRPMSDSGLWSRIGTDFRVLVWLSPRPSHLPRRLQEALAESAISGRLGVIFVLDDPPLDFRGTPLEQLLPIRLESGSARDKPGRRGREPDAGNRGEVRRDSTAAGAQEAGAATDREKKDGIASGGKGGAGDDAGAGSRGIELTEEGARHPAGILEGEGAAFWKSLPGPERPHPPAEAAGGCAILARTKAGSPILSAGAGVPRSIAIHSDEIWRWGFGSGERREGLRRAWRVWTLYAADGAGPRRRVELRLPARHPRPGEPLPFQVAVAMAPGEAAREMRASVRLARLGETGRTAEEPVAVEAAGEAPLFGGRTPPLGAGEYVLTAEAFLAGRKIGDDSAGLIVEGDDPELAPRRPDHDGMRSAAEMTGGKFAPASGVDAGFAADIASCLAAETVRHKMRISSRSDGWLLVLIAAALCVEWRIRRTKTGAG